MHESENVSRMRYGASSSAAKSEDARGTPTQSRISPGILEYKEKAPSRRGGVEA